MVAGIEQQAAIGEFHHGAFPWAELRSGFAMDLTTDLPGGAVVIAENEVGGVGLVLLRAGVLAVVRVVACDHESTRVGAAGELDARGRDRWHTSASPRLALVTSAVISRELSMCSRDPLLFW